MNDKMNLTQARAAIGKDVYYVPAELPTTITRATRPPHGYLTKLMLVETVAGVNMRAVVAHNTVLFTELIGVVGDTSIADMRDAYRAAYNRRKLIAAAEATELAYLETEVDLIDDPLPPPEPEPIEV